LNAKNLSKAEEEVLKMSLQGAQVEAYEVHSFPEK